MSSRTSRKYSGRSAKSMPLRTKKSEITDQTSLKILHRIKENQENLLIVYQIREELMKNVMDLCCKKDIERSAVLFVVQCAYKAIMQIIDLNFYVHDPGKDDFEKNPEWTADQAIEPSPADTWAAYNVPLVGDLEVKEPSVPRNVVSQESMVTCEVQSYLTDYSAPCSLISEPYMSYSVSDYSECLLAPNVSEEVIPESVSEENESVSEVSKEISLFTKIATLYNETDSSKVYSDYKHRDTDYKRDLKLPKIPKIGDDKKPKTDEVKISASTLPPLRADTILQRTQSPVAIKRRNSVSPRRK